MLICLDGTFLSREDAEIPISDGGFLFGETLFETLKAHEQTIFLLPQHLNRLEQSAKALIFPCHRQKIEDALQQMAAALESPVSRIRLTLSRGDFTGLAWPSAGRGRFLITATEYIEPTDDERQSGVACSIAPNQRVNPVSHLPQMKRGNYADCLYAANFAYQNGTREALFLDQQQNILEGCSSNVFAFIDDRLVTPPLGSLVLNGIMRQQVINAATESGIVVIERDLPFRELEQAEEIFLTNSLIGILPVSRIENQTINREECRQYLLKTLRQRIDT
ncbi:aminotransferase class IV [uncultured Desulfuromusa sp.]|uniref:aminotransferase class IV n=1 Tax=uncultured Desulfuromusa sp. TaxID=219183 RepID=UPI002AA7702A|nr:aminotransferase class IV [uncultured Desulfuromusa sp.]